MRNRFLVGISFLFMVGLLSVSLTSCGGIKSEYVAPAIALPPHIKSLAVKPIQNETSVTDIGNKLWIAITDECIRDGRLPYIDKWEEADGVIVGTLKQYIETPLSYDVNLVPREYQLWVIMDLKLLDRKNNQYLWQEPFLEQKIRYFIETEPGGKTQEQAREELWDRFAVDVVRRTVEGFGTVTSASPKSVPQKPVQNNPPPVYQGTSPY